MSSRTPDLSLARLGVGQRIWGRLEVFLGLDDGVIFRSAASASITETRTQCRSGIHKPKTRPAERLFHGTAGAQSYAFTEEDRGSELELTAEDRSPIVRRQLGAIPEHPLPGSVESLIREIDRYLAALQKEEDFFTPERHHDRAQLWKSFALLAKSSPSVLTALKLFEFKAIAKVARLTRCSPQRRVERVNLVLQSMTECGIPHEIWCYEARMIAQTDLPGGLDVGIQIIRELETRTDNRLPFPRYRTYGILLRLMIAQNGAVAAEKWIRHEFIGKALVQDPQCEGNTVVATWDIQLCNALIHGYADTGDMVQALRLVASLESLGMRPNSFTWLYIMHGHVINGDRPAMMRVLQVVKKAHVRPTKALYEMLICGLLHCGRKERDYLRDATDGPPKYPRENLDESRAIMDASEIHDEMKEEYRSGLSIYNLFMSAFVRRGELEKVEELFRDMKREGISPDAASYSLLISTRLRAADLDGADAAFEHMCAQGVEPDLVVYGNILSAHGRLGSMDKVRKYLQHMRKYGFRPNYHIWHILINAYCCNRDMAGAAAIVEQMKAANYRVTEITYVTMMDGYGLVGDLDGVGRMFAAIMNLRVSVSIYAFNTAIAAYARNGDRESAMRCYMLMIETGYPPDRITFNILINMEAQRLDAVGAAELYRTMVDQGTSPNERTLAPLINLHVKRSDMTRAKAMQREMLVCASGSIVPHNSLLAGFVRQRRPADAEAEYRFATAVHGARPDIRTFDMLVRVHAHDADIEGARKWFAKALELDVKPDTALWNALLTAYVAKGDASGAFQVFEEMREAGCKGDIFTATLMLKVRSKTDAAASANKSPDRPPKLLHKSDGRISVTAATERRHNGMQQWAKEPLRGLTTDQLEGRQSHASGRISEIAANSASRQKLIHGPKATGTAMEPVPDEELDALIDSEDVSALRPQPAGAHVG
ncbi:hypothetical protein HDU86_005849 [Geranomyces michiganensis]|nr:hypothetical protein HDU86_005849 [Geranomyces michiganensis]